MLIDFFDAFARDYHAYKRGTWCYEDGLLYRGLQFLSEATGDPRWEAHLMRLINEQVQDGPEGATLFGYDPAEFNVDHVLSGRSLLYLHEKTGEARWLSAAGHLLTQLKNHPRTKSGVYWHKLKYPWQVWLDGLYMWAPFQIGYGQETGDDALVADALQQVSTALDMTYNASTGLYAHAVDEARLQPWANAQTGHNPAHWSRAVGWLAMALVDIRELVGAARFEPLEARTRALLKRTLELRQPSGLWLQVMDQPDLAGNYGESSASAMFVYALQKGSALGLCDAPSDLMEKLTAGVMKQGANGPEMAEMCEVAGLGYYESRFRDGSAEYYVSEKVVSDDVKGVGPMMMAYAVSLELEGQRMPSKVSA